MDFMFKPCLLKVSYSINEYPVDPSPHMMITSASGWYNLAARANPAPTPNVPKAPGSNQQRLCLRFKALAAVAIKSPPSPINIVLLFGSA